MPPKSSSRAKKTETEPETEEMATSTEGDTRLVELTNLFLSSICNVPFFSVERIFLNLN